MSNPTNYACHLLKHNIHDTTLFRAQGLSTRKGQVNSHVEEQRMPVDPPIDSQTLVSRALHRLVRLPEFSQPVYIEEAQTSDDLVSLSVRTRDGQTDKTIVPAADLANALNQATQQGTSSTLADPHDFFLLVEAARIRLAYSFDPFFAVSMSGVQALPHQLQAVYERMLPQARLRFLLADDPGAGKTIMAGGLVYGSTTTSGIHHPRTLSHPTPYPP